MGWFSAGDAAQPHTIALWRRKLSLLFRSEVRPETGPVADRSVGQEAGRGADFRASSERVAALSGSLRRSADYTSSAAILRRCHLAAARHANPRRSPHAAAWYEPRDYSHISVSRGRRRLRPGA